MAAALGATSSYPAVSGTDLLTLFSEVEDSRINLDWVPQSEELRCVEEKSESGTGKF